MRFSFLWLLAWLAVLLTGGDCWARAGFYRPPPLPTSGGGGGGGGIFPFLPEMGSELTVILLLIGAAFIGWTAGDAVRRWASGSSDPVPSGRPREKPPAPGPPASNVFLNPDVVAEKAQQTTQLLETLAQKDPLFNPDQLKALVTNAFLEVQWCWQERDYDPVRPLLMRDLFAKHEKQLRHMRHNREINRLEDIHILRLEFLHVFCPDVRDDQEFTVLITAQAKDYYVSEQTGAFLRGDRQASVFQDFWTFRRQENSWRVQAIEQSDESSHLHQANYAAGRGDAEASH